MIPGRKEFARSIHPRREQGCDWSTAATQATRRHVGEFLAGRPEAVDTISGWIRAVAEHEAWGFETAEDIVQATILALVRNFRAGRFAGGNLKGYVRRVAKNICISDYRRSRVRGRCIPLEETAGSEPSLAVSEDKDRRIMLERILDGLEERCREILALAYVQGLSRSEIGTRLGISPAAARVRLFRCIQSARAGAGASE